MMIFNFGAAAGKRNIKSSSFLENRKNLGKTF
jgi:hypothetical protein